MSKSHYLKKFITTCFKPFVWLIGMLTLLPILLLCYGLFFFNANDYKKEIADYLSQKTQMDVLIEGDIRLKWLPNLALSIQHIALHSALQQPFLDIEQLDLRIPLSTLLRATKTIEAVDVNGMTLYLEQHLEKNNWPEVLRLFSASCENDAPQNTPSSATTRAISTLSNEHTTSKLKFSIARIDVKNSQIHYYDRAAQQHIRVKNLNFFSNAVQLQNIPLAGEFALEVQAKQTFFANAKISGFVHLKPTPSFKLDTSLLIQESKSLPMTRIDGILKAQLNDSFSWKSLNIESGTQRLQGELHYHVDKRLFAFDLQTDELDLSSMHFFNSSKPSAVKTSQTTQRSTVLKAEAPFIPNPLASWPHWQGQIKIKSLHLDRWTLQNVTTKLHSEIPDVITGTLLAQAFEGELQTQFDCDFSPKAQRIVLKGALNNFNSETLLSASKQPDLISGNGFLHFHLMKDPDHWHGTMDVDIQHGQLKKVDLPYCFTLAESLLKHQDARLATNLHATNFDSLKGTFYLHDKQIDNHHLTLLAKDIKASATGTVYLPSTRLEYKVQAYRLPPQSESNGLPLAIRIHGTLLQPVIEPQLDVYLKVLLKEKTQKKIEKKIDQHLHKIAPNAMNDTSDQEVKKMLNKEIEKGLKKLLKRKDE